MTLSDLFPRPFVPNEEGVWLDLPESVYRAAPGISQSQLKAFDAEPTPAHYKESLMRPREATGDMEFGTILHTAILQPHLLSEVYHLRPETYPSARGEKPWHGGSDWCKEWEKAHEDRPIIDAEKESRIPRIVSRVMDMPVVGDMIRSGQKEVAYFKRDRETGLLLKCRVDCVATEASGNTWILDLKKVRRNWASGEPFADSCADRGYDIQCASYLALSGASKFILVAMEDEAPFEAQPFELDEEDIAKADVKWREILLRFAEAEAAACWPGYTPTIKRLKMPKWARKERQQEGTLYNY